MSQEETDILKSILNDLIQLAGIVTEIPQPARAIIESNLFITRQKVRSLLGDKGSASLAQNVTYLGK